MNEPKGKNSYSALATLTAIALLCVFIGLFGFRANMKNDLMDSNFESLKNVLEQQLFAFSSKVEDQKSALEIYTGFYKEEGLNEEEILSKLKTIAQNTTFDYVTYAFPNGDAIENTGVHLNITDREYFQKAIKGKTIVANPVLSKLRQEQIVTFSVPIFKNGNVEGILIGIYGADNLSKILKSSFNGKGVTYITTGDGQVIFKTEKNSNLEVKSDLKNALKKVNFYGKNDLKTILEDIEKNVGGYAQYEYEGESKFMYYAPAGINDWYIFTVVQEEFITPQSLNIMYNTTIYLLVTCLLLVGILGFTFFAQRRHLKETMQLAFVDALTGCPTKGKFRIEAMRILSERKRNYVLAIMDIDKFKILNDTLGYEKGDQLLLNITRNLKIMTNNYEFFGRCESDEFLLIWEFDDEQNVKQRLKSLLSSIEAQFEKDAGKDYKLVLCIGVYIVKDYGESIDLMGDRARHAHSLIKGLDESSVCFYTEEIRNKKLKDKEIENKMHGALLNEEFQVYLQPKVFLKSRKVSGAEALVRWDSSTLGFLTPDSFIDLFEKTGFVVKLDMYMLDRVCKTLRRWLDQKIEPIPISINFSTLHLKNENFVDDIADIVKQNNVPTTLIEIELTEATMLSNEELLLKELAHLHEHGFTLSIDDFGSGYSSLGLLKNLPVDVIKLDKTFFAEYDDIERAKAVVSSVIDMAQNLGINTVAEGVETLEQVELLSELGCDIVQGYYFGKPMPIADLEIFLDVSRRGYHEY